MGSEKLLFLFDTTRVCQWKAFAIMWYAEEYVGVFSICIIQLQTLEHCLKLISVSYECMYTYCLTIFSTCLYFFSIIGKCISSVHYAMFMGAPGYRDTMFHM